MSIFNVRMSEDGDSVDILLHAPIGNSLFEEGITSQQIVAELARAGKAKNIHLRLNSPGGSVWEGMAIRAALAAHPAHVKATVEGLAASCASVVCMAADEIHMHTGTRMMIHEARVHTAGTVADHKKAIEAMDSINRGAAEIYAARSGQSLDAVLALMAEETWLTPERAVELGFANKVIAAKGGNAVMSFDLKPYGYHNVPPQLAAGLPGDKPPAPKETPMSFARIAMALALGEGADEAAVIAAVDRMKTERSRTEVLLAELRNITGKTTQDEVLGAVRGFAQASQQLTAARAELLARDEQLAASERAQLIAADASNPKGRKLTPAVAKLFADKPVAELKAFLEVAQPIAGTGLPGGSNAGSHAGGTQQPNVSTTDADGGGSSQTQVMKHEGKSWEEMKPYEKHNLFVDNKPMFDALKNNHAVRMRA